MLRSRAVTVVAVSTCGCLLRAVDDVAGQEDLLILNPPDCCASLFIFCACVGPCSWVAPHQREAGRVITDPCGHPLDFGLGRMLSTNYGVVAMGKDASVLNFTLSIPASL
jgi:hypothetical protein